MQFHALKTHYIDRLDKNIPKNWIRDVDTNKWKLMKESLS